MIPNVVPIILIGGIMGYASVNLDMITAMIMPTVILCAMFAIFLTSTMNVLVNIGWLSIVGLGNALISDYTITPVLLYIFMSAKGETD